MVDSSKEKAGNLEKQASADLETPSSQPPSDRQVETQSGPLAEAANAVARRLLIEVTAYYRAERRGFGPGSELDDWYAAEGEVDQHLARARSATTGT